MNFHGVFKHPSRNICSQHPSIENKLIMDAMKDLIQRPQFHWDTILSLQLKTSCETLCNFPNVLKEFHYQGEEYYLPTNAQIINVGFYLKGADFSPEIWMKYLNLCRIYLSQYSLRLKASTSQEGINMMKRVTISVLTTWQFLGEKKLHFVPR